MAIDNGLSTERFIVEKRKEFSAYASVKKEYMRKCFSFAWDMTYGGKGKHKTIRSGGSHNRKLSEIFINTFQGKLAEYGVYQYLCKNGLNINEPDTKTYDLGIWDMYDLEWQERRISVKSTSYRGNLLLLETKDWNKYGEYVHARDDKSKYDYTVLVRIGAKNKDAKIKDIKKIKEINKITAKLDKLKDDFEEAVKLDNKSKKNEIKSGIDKNRDELKEEIYSYDFKYDFSFIDHEEFLKMTNSKQIICKGTFLNNNPMPMDAENYFYLMSEMREGFGLKEALENKKPINHRKRKYSEADRDELKNELEELFGYDDFLNEEQFKAVCSSLNDENLFVSFPTGGGKSLSFQLPALIKWNDWKENHDTMENSPLTIVISPLQSLMEDQIDELDSTQANKNGFDDEVEYGSINGDDSRFGNEYEYACAIHGGRNDDEREAAGCYVKEGNAAILYLSPESLLFKSTRYLIRNRHISRIVIDEAHCFEEWGRDFRQDYRYISKFCKMLKEWMGYSIPVSCFTATATIDVRSEIEKCFEDSKFKEISIPFERSNLNYYIHDVNDVDYSADPYTVNEEVYRKKCEILWDMINPENKGNIKVLEKDDYGKYSVVSPVIVYTLFPKTARTVAWFLEDKMRELNSETKEVCYTNLLEKKPYKNAESNYAKYYHGQISKKEKKAVLDAFKNSENKKDYIIVANSAFGMGVNNPRVKCVINFDLPESFNSYIQEAGRAGRDGKTESECHIIYSKSDYEKHDFLRRQNHFSVLDVEKVWECICDEDMYPLDENGFKKVIISDIVKKCNIDNNKVKSSIQALCDVGYLDRDLNEFDIRDDEDTKGIRYIIKLLFDKKTYTPLFSDETRKEFLEFAGLPEDITISPIMIDYQILLSEAAYLRDHNSHISSFELKKKLSEKNEIIITIFRYAQYHTNRNWTDYCRSYEKKKIECNPEISTETHKLMIKSASRIYGRKLRLFGKDYELTKEDAEKKDFEEIFDTEQIGSEVKLEYEKDGKTYSDATKYEKMKRRECKCETRKIDKEAPQNINSIKIKQYIDAVDFVEKYCGEAGQYAEFSQDSSVLNEESLSFLSDCGMISYKKAHTYGACLTVLKPLKKRFRKSDFKFLDGYYCDKENDKNLLTSFTECVRNNMTEQQIIRSWIEDYYETPIKDFCKEKGVKLYSPDEIKDKEVNSIFEYNGNMLDDYQQKVVTYKLGEKSSGRILLVTAGPGSGKTATITKKIEHLIKIEGYRPSDILALSYTNKTNEVLMNRVWMVMGSQSKGISFYTFDRFANRLLGKNGEFGDKIIEEASNELNSNGVVDDGLLDKKILILDEAQDLNKAKTGLVRALMGKISELKLIAVMDPDQSIYEYSSNNNGPADFKNIIELYETKGYGDRKLSLVINYRSKKEIIENNELFREETIKFSERKSMEPADPNNDGGNVVQYNVKDNEDINSSICNCVIHDVEEIAKKSDRSFPVNIGILRIEQADRDNILNTLNDYFDEAVINKRRIIVKKNITKKDSHKKGEFFFPISWLDEFHCLIRELNDSCDKKTGMVSKEKICFCMNYIFGFYNPYYDSIYREPVEKFMREYIRKYGNENGINLRHLVDRLGDIRFDDFRDQYIYDDSCEGDIIITVSTIHSAKGMEFDDVYMAYADEEKFNSDDDISKVRYVAMTRARTNLYIFDSGESNVKGYSDDQKIAPEYEHKKKVSNKASEKTGKENPDRTRLILENMVTLDNLHLGMTRVPNEKVLPSMLENSVNGFFDNSTRDLVAGKKLGCKMIHADKAFYDKPYDFLYITTENHKYIIEGQGKMRSDLDNCYNGKFEIYLAATIVYPVKDDGIVRRVFLPSIIDKGLIPDDDN